VAIQAGLPSFSDAKHQQLETKVDELEATVEELETKVEKLQGLIDDSNEELDAKEWEMYDLRIAVEAKDAKIDDLESQIIEHQMQAEFSEDELKSLREFLKVQASINERQASIHESERLMLLASQAMEQSQAEQDYDIAVLYHYTANTISAY